MPDHVTRLPELVPGDVVKVTLYRRHVHFRINNNDCRLKIDLDMRWCGMRWHGNRNEESKIALAVTLSSGAKVTIIPYEEEKNLGFYRTDIRWAEFHQPDAAPYIQLTDTRNSAAVSDDCPALEGSLVRAAWSSRGARAFATIRVDSVGRGLKIGVINDQYMHIDEASMEVTYWSVVKSARIEASESDSEGSDGVRPVELLVPGSVVRVTLKDREVSFNVDGRTIPDLSFNHLPDSKMKLTLGVKLYAGAKVTLLP